MYTPGSSLGLLTLQPKPCGEGSWLTFSTAAGLLKTVMTFCLQTDLWAPAHGW